MILTRIRYRQRVLVHHDGFVGSQSTIKIGCSAEMKGRG